MRVRRWSVIVLAILIAILSDSAWARRRRGRTEAGEPRGRSESSAQQRIVRPTFLDTLNEGKELCLTDEDFSSMVRPQDTSSAQPSSSATGQKEGFRIQCIASSDIEAVRAKKKAVEAKLDYKAYIVFAKPYYKLHIGDFTARKDAQSALARVKEAGYPKAWIVRSKVLVQR